jgi:hypothetical protein
MLLGTAVLSTVLAACGGASHHAAFTYKGPLQLAHGAPTGGAQVLPNGTEVDFTVQMWNEGSQPVTLLSAKRLVLPKGGAPAELVDVGAIRSLDAFSGLRGWPPKFSGGQTAPLRDFVVPGKEADNKAANIAEVAFGVELSGHAAFEVLGGLILTYRVGDEVKHAAAWGAVALCSQDHHGPGIKQCGRIVNTVLFPEINTLDGLRHS